MPGIKRKIFFRNKRLHMDEDVCQYYTRYKGKRCIYVEGTSMNYSDLLNDLQMLIDSLNDTVNFIKTCPPKEDVETCLHCDGNKLNLIRVCLRNGGYDND